MTKTKTIVTTEEVEAVDCSSCGQEIEKDKAHKFIIHEETNNKTFDDNNPNQYRDGWACQHCVENPISFPVIYRTFEITGWFELIGIYLLIIFSIIMIVQILSII